MAEQSQTGKSGDRTYQEVEYLKKNLGPILVAALAEICIRRPADPIEYLGHWLLRWRYNEELKRRDVQNALEVVRQKTWTKEDEAAAAPVPTGDFNQGFTPSTPAPAPGFGGPLEAPAEEAPAAAPEEGEAAAADAPPAEGEAAPEGEEAAPPAEGEGPSETGEPAEPAAEEPPSVAEEPPSEAAAEEPPPPTAEEGEEEEE